MKVLLFDWTTGGHHPIYAQRFVDAFHEHCDLAVAFPDEISERVRGPAVQELALGSPRPPVDADRPLAAQHRELAERELDLLIDAVHQAAPDHVIHLYADPILRRLVVRRALPVPTTLCVFFPRAHYPRSFDSPLRAREKARAWFLEALVARWRRREDAHALFTLDEVAARRWSRRRGAPSYWLPEPPVEGVGARVDERSGFVVYGTLADRKGIDLVSRAISVAPTPIEVILAGEVECGYQARLMELVAGMQRSGAIVDLRLRRHSEDEGLDVLAGASCTLLPYLDHYTTSRVLLESATVGTPVIAHERGLLGHLVRTHGLGVTVDCSDASSFRDALLHMSQPDVAMSYSGAMARYAARFTPDRFRSAVLEPFVQRARSQSGTRGVTPAGAV